MGLRPDYYIVKWEGSRFDKSPTAEQIGEAILNGISAERDSDAFDIDVREIDPTAAEQILYG